MAVHDFLTIQYKFMWLWLCKIWLAKLFYLLSVKPMYCLAVQVMIFGLDHWFCRLQYSQVCSCFSAGFYVIPLCVSRLSGLVFTFPHRLEPIDQGIGIFSCFLQVMTLASRIGNIDVGIDL